VRDLGATVYPGIFTLLGPHTRLAAQNLLEATNTVILTGFPCLVDHTPPTETDGPPGAIALARCCAALGQRVTLITDDCNADPVKATLRGAGAFASDVLVESFPPASDTSAWADGGASATLLRDIAEAHDHVIAIERAGPAADGTYRTMRGRDMTSLVAPLERLIPLATEVGASTTGIGDGGNEVGMGAVRDRIVARQSAAVA